MREQVGHKYFHCYYAVRAFLLRQVNCPHAAASEQTLERACAKSPPYKLITID
jgi:hypothetical protein